MTQRTERQKVDAINQARLAELKARSDERWAKNPVSAFFSDLFGEGAEEHNEAMHRTFTEGHASHPEVMEALKRKVGYKGKPKTQTPWETWGKGNS